MVLIVGITAQVFASIAERHAGMADVGSGLGALDPPLLPLDEDELDELDDEELEVADPLLALLELAPPPHPATPITLSAAMA